MESWNGSGESRRPYREPPRRKTSSGGGVITMNSQTGSIHNQLRANISSIRSRGMMLSQRKSSMVNGFVSAVSVSSKGQKAQTVYDLYANAQKPRSVTHTTTTITNKISVDDEEQQPVPEIRVIVKPKKPNKTRESKDGKVFKGRVRSNEISRERVRCSEQKKKKKPIPVKPPKVIKPEAKFRSRVVTKETKAPICKVSPKVSKPSTKTVPKVQSRKKITNKASSIASIKKDFITKKNNSFTSQMGKAHASSYSDINRWKVRSAGSDRWNNRHSYQDKLCFNKTAVVVEKKKTPKWRELLDLTERCLLTDAVPTKVLVTHTRVIPDQVNREICLYENVTVKRRIPFKEASSEFMMHLAEREMRRKFVPVKVLLLDTMDSKSGIGYVKQARESCKGNVPRIEYTNKVNVLRNVESSPSVSLDLKSMGVGAIFDFQKKMIELARVKETRMQKWTSYPIKKAVVVQMDTAKLLQIDSSVIFGKTESNESAFYDWPDRPSIFKGLRNSRSSSSSCYTPPKPNREVRKKSSLIFQRSIDTSNSEEDDEDLVEPKPPPTIKPVSIDRNLFPKPSEESVSSSTRQPAGMLREDPMRGGNSALTRRPDGDQENAPTTRRPSGMSREDTTTTYLVRGANSALMRRPVAVPSSDIGFDVDQFGNCGRLSHHIDVLKRAQDYDRKEICKRLEAPASCDDKTARAEQQGQVKSKNFFNFFKKRSNAKRKH